jgi:hypothetical protein
VFKLLVSSWTNWKNVGVVGINERETKRQIEFEGIYSLFWGRRLEGGEKKIHRMNYREC